MDEISPTAPALLSPPFSTCLSGKLALDSLAPLACFWAAWSSIWVAAYKWERGVAGRTELAKWLAALDVQLELSVGRKASPIIP